MTCSRQLHNQVGPAACCTYRLYLDSRGVSIKLASLCHLLIRPLIIHSFTVPLASSLRLEYVFATFNTYSSICLA
jgi:hypothetical protein